MKKLRAALLALLILTLVLCAYVPIQQQILRHRAERLLADIQGIQLRKSTWADAQILMKRWGAWGKYEGSCSESLCVYRIELADGLSSASENHPRLLEHWETLEMLYSLFGGRPVQIVAGFRVGDGLLWGKGFNAYVRVSPNNSWNYPHTLIASSGSSPNFFPYRISPELLLHPEYLTGSPGGCTGCLEVWAKFTPYATPQDVSRLMKIDLSCITRRNECREREDIMPTVWPHAIVGNLKLAEERLRNCEIPLQLLGREAENVAEVEIEASQIERADGEDFRSSKVRLVRRLKASDQWEIGFTRDIEIDRPLKGQHYFVFYSDSDFNWRPARSLLSLDECGLIPATAENLAAIQAGIERDFASKR